MSEPATTATAPEDVTPTPGAEFHFAAAYLPDAIKRIEAANRKLAKAGITDRFGYTTEDYILDTTNEAGFPVREHRIKLTLDRPSIAFGGWEFVATLVHEDAGVIARTVPGKSLDGWTPTGKTCDHCHTSRARKDTYVVRHVGTPDQPGTGEIKQIGSNCLTPFLGVSPTGLWSLDWQPEIGDHEERGERNPHSGDLRVPVRDLLAVALAVSDHGKAFVTRSVADTTGKPSTAAQVFDVLFGRGGKAEDRKWREDMHAASRAILDNEGELIDELLDLGRNMDGYSSYVTNMKVLAASEWIDPRNAALLVSIITTWNREQGRLAEQKARVETAAKGYLADVDAKIADVPAVITFVTYIDDIHKPGGGTKTVIAMRAENTGHELKWFATGRKDVEVGDQVTITRATVKKHDAYKGVDQTVITRAKLEKREQA